MPYYSGRGDCMYGRGDYYQGDYYQGDLFKKLIGGVAKVAKIGVSLVPGGGIVKEAAQLALAKFGKPPAHLVRQYPAPTLLPAPGGPFGGGVRMLQPLPEFDGGYEPGTSLTPSGALVPCRLPGYRKNKSSYYRKNLTVPGSGTLIPKGSVCVKARRMNVGNARALMRSLRRAYGFKKLAMKTVRLLDPTKPKRFGGFKKKR